MAKKKKGPLRRRNDAELIGRLRDEVPDILNGTVDFDAIVDSVISQPTTHSEATTRGPARKKAFPMRARFLDVLRVCGSLGENFKW